MSLNIKIVVPTKQSKKEFSESQCYKCIESLIVSSTHIQKNDINIILKPFTQNSTGLSELFQEELNKKDCDYTVFLHDDLEVHDHFFIQKLIKAHEHYDIVGLAGATTQDYTTGKPLVWHLSREKPEHSRGIVNHFIPKGFNNVSKSHINSAYFGPTPDRVVVIDGLFMSFKMSSLKDKGEIFDRNFTFHHYDMAMCCNAYDKELSIGVWPIFVIHHGLGEFANDKLWQKHEIEFRQKHSNRIMKI